MVAVLAPCLQSLNMSHQHARPLTVDQTTAMTRPTRDTFLARVRRGGLGLGLCVASAQLAPTAPAVALSAAEDEPVQLQALTATGSNPRRLDFEKTLPVTLLGRDEIELRDAPQAADLLAALPQFTGLPGNETATLGATARGDNSSASLRGIPSANTLILLNGRRLPLHPMSQGGAGVPNLSTNVNILPNRGLERVDMLRDGAASICGTDAVAGGVNTFRCRSFFAAEHFSTPIPVTTARNFLI